jgi:hypothetical protein
VKLSWRGRIDTAGGNPAIRAGKVRSAGVKKGIVISSPDDHFAASPYSAVTTSTIGCIGGVGGYPTIRARIVSSACVQEAWTIDHHNGAEISDVQDDYARTNLLCEPDRKLYTRQ